MSCRFPCALSLAVFCGTGAAPAVAEVTWRGGFEGGSVPAGAKNGWDAPTAAPGITVVAEPTRVGRTHAGRFEIASAAAAGADGWQRVELHRALGEKTTAEGSARFFAFSIYVPKALPAVPHQIARFAGPDGKTLFAFVANGETVDVFTYEPTAKGHYGGTTSRLRPGVWNKVVLRVLWSKDDQRGILECWYNDDLMVANLPLRTRPAGAVTYTLGLSREAAGKPAEPSLAFIDEPVESTRLADLRAPEIPRAPGDFHPDVEYARPQGVSLRLDAWIPKGKGPHPAVILVHGGGFVRGDKQSYIRPVFHVLADAGFAWFSIDHRLAPRYQWPAPLDDVETAVKWVHTHAAQYHIDSKRVALWGESSGAFLVSAAGVRSKRGGPLAAVLPFYGPHTIDLPKPGPDGSIPMPTKGALVDLFGIKDTSPATQAYLRAAMPLYNVHADMPPFGLYHSRNDAVVPFAQSVRMCEAIKAVGGRCDVMASEDLGHGIFGKWKDLPAEHARLVSWLREVMNVPAGGQQAKAGP
jgi:acetyl esterase